MCRRTQADLRLPAHIPPRKPSENLVLFGSTGVARGLLDAFRRSSDEKARTVFETSPLFLAGTASSRPTDVAEGSELARRQELR
jgi:hypothetical protein